MISEAVELYRRIASLTKWVEAHRFDDDPIALAMKKTQLGHMHDYFSTLMLRCEMEFEPADYISLVKDLGDDTE